MSRILKIGYPINFRKAKLPSKKKLVGNYAVLEPLQIKKHSIDLYKSFSKDKSKSIRLISLKILQKTNQKTFGDTCLMVRLKIQKHL